MSGAEGPLWQSVLPEERQRLLLRLLEEELTRRGLRHEVRGGGVLIARDAGPGITAALDNLAQVVRDQPPDEWAGHIASHLDAILPALSNLQGPPATFAEARAGLRLRVWADDQLPPEAGRWALSRRLAEGLLGVVAYDLPTAVVSVSSESVAAWGVGEEELFAAAVEGTRSEPPPGIERVDIEGGAGVVAIEGESVYTATALLWLDEHLPGIPEAEGALVVVPNRHIVVAHPVSGLRSLRAVVPMLQMAGRLYERGPGSISRDIYWWRSGTLMLLPHRIADGTLEFLPPDEFLLMLGTLADRGDDV